MPATMYFLSGFLADTARRVSIRVIRFWSLDAAMRRTLLPSLFLTLCIGSSAYGGETWIQVAGGAWQPERDTLQLMQERIEAFVRHSAQSVHRSLREWASYTFQYQGQVAGGRKYLYVSALCAVDPGVNLHARFFLVTDGGSCYFTVKFDPVARQFYDLVINREA